jgi:hypothetical protein
MQAGDSAHGVAEATSTTEIDHHDLGNHVIGIAHNPRSFFFSGATIQTQIIQTFTGDISMLTISRSPHNADATLFHLQALGLGM